MGNLNSSTSVSSKERKASLCEVGDHQRAESEEKISSSYTQSGTPWKREALPVDVMRMGLVLGLFVVGWMRKGV